MAAYVQVWHFKPKINVRIVHLTFGLGGVLFFSGTSNHDKFLPKPACRVTVSWVLHGVTLDELVVVVDLNLIERVESIIITLVVTTTNEEELLREGVLHALEIVGEAAVVVWLHLDCLYSLVANVKLVNIFGIFLQKMNYLNWRAGVLISAQVE